MFNFAILTAGNIAAKMASTVNQMPQVHCYAVAARDGERAKEFAQTYGFERWYDNYESLFSDPKVDIVYIGSPHSHHYQQVKQALQAKKHVLCEKPMTVNAKQAEELFALAKENGVILTEATWTRYMPFVAALQEVLQQGVIGTPLSMKCSFGFPVSDRPRMAQPELAGGALLDLGIYPLTMAAIAFGTDVVEMTSACTKTPAGVDAYNSIILKFAQGQIASLQSNMLCTLDNSATIYGEKGHIFIRSFWQAEDFVVIMEDGRATKHSFPHKITGYEYEVEQLCHAIEQGWSECPAMPHSETLKILNWMDDLRSHWDIFYLCEKE